jgi:hypothetical protein
MSLNYDPQNVKGRLEHLFLSRGFNVVSESVAKDRIEYEEQISDTINTQTIQGSIGRVKRMRSEYVLEFSYSTRPDFPNVWVFSSFSATVINLDTGKIIASANFSQGGFTSDTINTVLTNFVDKLVSP